MKVGQWSLISKHKISENIELILLIHIWSRLEKLLCNSSGPSKPWKALERLTFEGSLRKP